MFNPPDEKITLPNLCTVLVAQYGKAPKGGARKVLGAIHDGKLAGLVHRGLRSWEFRRQDLPEIAARLGVVAAPTLAASVDMVRIHRGLLEKAP